jgi:hypothetical protein
MATFLRTTVVPNIGTTLAIALQATNNGKFTIIGCNLANTTDNDVIIDIQIVDANLVTGYYIKQLVISPYTSVKVITNGEKLILAENCQLTIVSDTVSSIDAVISYAEIV